MIYQQTGHGRKKKSQRSSGQLLPNFGRFIFVLINLRNYFSIILINNFEYYGILTPRGFSGGSVYFKTRLHINA